MLKGLSIRDKSGRWNFGKLGIEHLSQDGDPTSEISLFILKGGRLVGNLTGARLATDLSGRFGNPDSITNLSNSLNISEELPHQVGSQPLLF